MVALALQSLIEGNGWTAVLVVVLIVGFGPFLARFSLSAARMAAAVLWVFMFRVCGVKRGATVRMVIAAARADLLSKEAK